MNTRLLCALVAGIALSVSPAASQQLFSGGAPSAANRPLPFDIHEVNGPDSRLTYGELHGEVDVMEVDAERSPDLIERMQDHLAGLQPALQIYALKMVENRAFDDFKVLLEHEDNQSGSGQTWVLKVMAGEMALLSLAAEKTWPEIAGLYKERSDLYASMVRGEITSRELEGPEQANSRQLRTVFERELARIAAGGIVEPTQAEIDEAIDGLASMVIGGAKVLASED